MTPGETAFTRCGLNSTASGLINPSIAELIANNPIVHGTAARAEPVETTVNYNTLIDTLALFYNNDKNFHIRSSR